MESNEMNTQSNAESIRIPSPSSVSSIHSIRPLEWDSGADIGYQCKSQAGLSTVERMALVSGTANLFENCKFHDIIDPACHMCKFDRPVAHSSPFIGTSSISDLKLISSCPKSEHIDEKLAHPLVDYSFSSDHSFKDEIRTSNRSHNSSSSSSKSSAFRKSKLFNISIDNSKSLDDLRYWNQSSERKKSSAARSYSSNSVFHSLNRKVSTEKVPSSSSAATIVSPTKKTCSERKYSNKGVQVDEGLLDLKLNFNESVLSMPSIVLPKTTDIGFLRNLYVKNGKRDKSHSYTVGNGLEFRSSSSRCDKSDIDDGSTKNDGGSVSGHSNIESLDGGSFEYVPGSAFDEERLKQNSSSEGTRSSGSEVNTLCSEVVDGVDLITRYVDNLQVNNKKKIIKKMAQFLINNLVNEGSRRKDSKEASIQCKLRESVSSRLFVNSSPEMATRNQAPPIVSNHENDIISDNSNSEISKVQSENSGMVESSSQRRSSRVFSEPSSSSVCNKGDFVRRSLRHKVSTSSYSVDSDVNASLPRVKNVASNIAKIHSLKQYLAKERETQLLWIKSGISHLNNLRKLYESQRSLKQEPFLKSSSTEESCILIRNELRTPTNSEETSDTRALPKTPKRGQPKDKFSKINYSFKNDESPAKNIVTNSVPRKKILQPKNENEVSNKNDSAMKRNCACKCRCCGVNDLSVATANKENVAENSSIFVRSVRRIPIRKREPCVVRKPAISYTIVFDKNSTIFTNRHFRIKEQTMKNSINHIHMRRRKIRKTTSTTELECLQNDKPTFHSLKEYLLQNKPEYVHRAECRRQCLWEIARLRELRDKSRNELVSMIQKSNEYNTQPDNIPPPPLSVVRMFNDKSIRRQTVRKYQQLPEVLTKKVEMKRKENYRRNQIMAKVFTKKLQKKVLSGQVNLSSSVNVIST